MPDWQKLVSERLGSPDLTPEGRVEVVAELAAHLEDRYEEGLARGLKEHEAIRWAYDCVHDWSELASKICLAKHEVDRINKRRKAFWLPGLLVILMSIGLQDPSWRIVPQAWLYHSLLVPYLVWIMTLPLLGALGACLSCRILGSRNRPGPATVLFPSIAMFVLMFLDGACMFFVKNGLIIRHPYVMGLYILRCSALPALALLMGAMPFLRPTKLRDAHV